MKAGPGGTAILVFGAAVRQDGSPSPALRRRVATAVTWARAQSGEITYVVTGGMITFPPAEAVVMATLLREAGVPDDHIVQEASARNTFQSVWRSLPLLQELMPARIVVCTDDYHLPRCQWLLRLAGLHSLGIAARSESYKRWQRVREFFAVPVDTLRWILTH
jgi:vancomycin permeability regulator SanA